LAQKSKLKRGADPLFSYKSKRDFARTPEPCEGGSASAHDLIFVVQKHSARTLHYDFRLELDGTLKSWAIPKGPSLDSSVKRMAIEVEDHPLSYANFEGSIPAKLYGAGEVILWDSGTWTPLKEPLQAYREGNLKFELQGQKLHGKWVLIRMKGNGEKQAPWLLIKEKDSFVRRANEYNVVDEQPGSVRKSRAPPIPAENTEPTLPKQALRSSLPVSLAPQLATLVTGEPPDPAEWIYEIKFDGYRMLVRNDKFGARFFTRNGLDWSPKLGGLKRDFESLKLPPGWYDGELTLPDEAGLPDFAALQQAFENNHTNQVVLYLFDLPYCLGHDLRGAPLEARRATLRGLLAATDSDRIRFSEAFDAAPKNLIASACKLGLEGIIAKRRASIYRSSRSVDWLKLKCGLRQEFVIGGFTSPKGSRSDFGALLLGVHDGLGALQYAGMVGTGFSQEDLRHIRKALDLQARTSSPFTTRLRVEGKPHWVAPTLVAEVSFADWTRTGRIRHAVFRGLRTDKEARSIMREHSQLQASPLTSNTRIKPQNLTNPHRIIDASTGTTKADMAQYYGLVGKLIMMHLKGRPVSLVRAPAGVGGQLFFQKHLATIKLPGMRQVDSTHEVEQPPMIEVLSQQGLLSAAQWNVVEFHTQNNRILSPEHPNRMVFDLDPGDGVVWDQVLEAAQLMHSFLNQLGLPSFLKTSGGKGLHVVVPVRPRYDWDTVKGFSQAIVQHMATTIPKRFVARSGPKNRIGKIFIDYLRNGRGATTVCAWSARARPGLGISVPVTWSELPELRSGDHWDVKTIYERINLLKDPWTGYSNAAHDLSSAMSILGWSPQK
jgi:bifunctional non-homologous end joining protein LigD